MAGKPQPEEQPQLGWKATVAGLIFALAVLGGFGAATAISYDDDHGEDHSEEQDQNHADETLTGNAQDEGDEGEHAE